MAVKLMAAYETLDDHLPSKLPAGRTDTVNIQIPWKNPGESGDHFMVIEPTVCTRSWRGATLIAPRRG
jgi:hypothetical protein